MTDKTAHQNAIDVCRERDSRIGLLESKVSRLTSALLASQVALNDWLHTYAHDLCDPDAVLKAHDRIQDCGGTLVYIARVRETNRRALGIAQEENTNERGVA